MPLPLRLVIHKEKSLVLPNWPAQRTAKLIEIELLLESRKVALGIQVGVAEILVERPVQLVRSGFRRNQHRRTRARAIFRRVVVSENLKFLNGVNRGQNRNTARSEFGVVVVVDQPARTLLARASHRKRKRSTRRNFAAGRLGEKAVGAGLRGCTRSQGSQLHKVAAVQWEVRYFLCGDHLAEGWVRSFDSDFGGGDLDR